MSCDHFFVRRDRRLRICAIHNIVTKLISFEFSFFKRFDCFISDVLSSFFKSHEGLWPGPLFRRRRMGVRCLHQIFDNHVKQLQSWCLCPIYLGDQTLWESDHMSSSCTFFIRWSISSWLIHMSVTPLSNNQISHVFFFCEVVFDHALMCFSCRKWRWCFAK